MLVAAKKAKKAKPPKKLKVQEGPEKATVKSRTDCSALVKTNAPQSSLWASVPAIADAGNKLIAAGVALATADTTANKADADALAAHTVRDAAVVEWDAAFDVYSANVSQNAPKPADVTALGLNVQERGSYALAIPLGVALKFDAAASLLLIHVQPAPGLKSCEMESARTRRTRRRGSGSRATA